MELESKDGLDDWMIGWMDVDVRCLMAELVKKVPSPSILFCL